MPSRDWPFVKVTFVGLGGWNYALVFDLPEVTVRLAGISIFSVVDIAYTVQDIRQDVKHDIFWVVLKPSDLLRLRMAAGERPERRLLDECFTEEEAETREIRARDKGLVGRAGAKPVVLAWVRASKDPRKHYSVSVKWDSAGHPWMYCPCPGYHFHNGECKHVDAIMGRQTTVPTEAIRLTRAGQEWLAAGRKLTHAHRAST